MFVPGSRYVPSRGATYAEETSDTKGGIRINATAYIMAKKWLSMFVYHVRRSRKLKVLEKRENGGQKGFGGNQSEAVLK